MAYSLTGERQSTAALTLNPLRALARWWAEVRAARRQRFALHSLLELEEHRLFDLGISRGDVLEALAHQDSHRLEPRRSEHAQAWLRSA